MRSAKYQTASEVREAGTLPGQRAIMGVRIPPSYMSRLRPRRGPELSKIPSQRLAAPLSEQKKTRVFSSRSRFLSSVMMRPTSASIRVIIAACTLASCGQSRSV